MPTPSDMPGATKTDADVMDASGDDGELTPVKTGLSPEKLAELNRTLREEKREWERKAKEAQRQLSQRQPDPDAQKFRELLKEFGAEKPDEFDPRAELAKLRADIESERTERRRIEMARDTGLDPDEIGGKTEDEMRASAERAQARMQKRIEAALAAAKAPAAPPASTVTSNGKIAAAQQITSVEELKKLSPAERMQAYKDGRLDAMQGKTN